MKKYLQKIFSFGIFAGTFFSCDSLIAGTAWVYGVSQESGWIDVNKAWYPTPQDTEFFGEYSDVHLCWAAQASNMLQYWQNYYQKAGNTLAAGTPNGFLAGRENATRRQYEIFDYFASCWTDGGGEGYKGMQWYLSNTSFSTAGGSATLRVPDDESGSFFTERYPYPSALTNGAISGDLRQQVFTNHKHFSGLLIDSIIDRYCVIGLDVEFLSTTGTSLGGHALTLWGCEYDEMADGSRLLTKVYLTDSDDAEIKLGECTLSSDPNDARKLYLSGLESNFKAQVLRFNSLSVAEFIAIPEPSMFSFFAGTLILLITGTRRKRHCSRN